jgi:hypothetical protein
MVKPTRIALMVTVMFSAAGAHAQLVELASGPTIQAERPVVMRDFATFPQLSGMAQGLPPSDPLAPDLYRADPKLYARLDFNRNVGLEATLTNPDYLDRIKYLGSGPRLAHGAVIGTGGFNFQLAARLSRSVDEQLGVFSKVGMAALERQHQDGVTSSSGAWLSTGATYKLDRGQTATLEIPIGAMARKTMSGAASGYAARLNLGF